jgi:hypothetical protein
MRKAWIAAFIVALMPLATPSQAAVSVSIGINIPTYPTLVPVPGVPVYYAPAVNANYFFYDGMYWNFDGNQWYGSTWYNGPWAPVAPAAVPVYLWRIPVSYYRAPPPYFHGWVGNAPPRWDAHWGPVWVNEHHDWNHWDHHVVPARAPLPVYQRAYAGDHYPRAEEQVRIHNDSYHYAPREAAARAHYEEHGYHPVAAQQNRVNREQAHVNKEQQQVHHEQQQVHHEQQQVHHEQQHVEKEQQHVNKEKEEHDHH